MVGELLREISERPMLHGCIVGTLGMAVAQALWVYLPFWTALIAVIVLAAIVGGYVTGNS